MVVPRITCSVWGPAKTGKTTFAMSFPGPIAAVEIGETGIEDLMYKWGDKVDYRPLGLRKLAPTLDDHEQLLADFDGLLTEIVDGDHHATIVIDSASRLWRSIRLVKTQEGHEASGRKQSNRADYEPANDYFEQVFQVARRNRRLNLVLVHRHREKFAMVEDAETGRQRLQETGEIESRDYRGIENLVQVMVRTGKRPVFDPKTKAQVSSFVHTLELCRFRPDLEGLAIPNLDYNVLVEKVFGGNG